MFLPYILSMYLPVFIFIFFVILTFLSHLLFSIEPQCLVFF